MEKIRLTTEEYIEHMRKAPIACIDVVLFNTLRDKTLLFKRSNEPAKNIFFTPGGCIEKNETFKEAAVRKMEEELNIHINPARLEGPKVIEDIWPNSKFDGINYHAITTYFGYTLTAEEEAAIALDAQHDESAWFTLDDATLCENVKERIRSLT
jgi:colanic acid biosynthesis protein WcaH